MSTCLEQDAPLLFLEFVSFLGPSAGRKERSGPRAGPPLV